MINLKSDINDKIRDVYIFKMQHENFSVIPIDVYLTWRRILESVKPETQFEFKKIEIDFKW